MPLQLQPRLQKLFDLIPPGARLADIGTDHGYLPVRLLQEGRISAAIAADVVAEPLEHARRTAREQGVKGIDFRLCDGLSGIAPQEVDTIVIAGMGGETIIAILSAAPWLRQGGCRLFLQPMTKVEILRKWIADNGFHFTGEWLVWDKDYLYPIMEIRVGEMPKLTAAQEYGGVLLEADPLYGDYLDLQTGKLRRAIEGLRRAKDCCSYGRSCDLQLICEALERKRSAL